MDRAVEWWKWVSQRTESEAYGVSRRTEMVDFKLSLHAIKSFLGLI